MTLGFEEFGLDEKELDITGVVGYIPFLLKNWVLSQFLQYGALLHHAIGATV
jgi:hypothetical protein